MNLNNLTNIEEKYHTIYSQIVKLLVGHGYSDIVKECQEIINYGKAKKKWIKGRKYTTIEEFSELEKIEILLKGFVDYLNSKTAMLQIQASVKTFFESEGLDLYLPDVDLDNNDNNAVKTSETDNVDNIWDELTKIIEPEIPGLIENIKEKIP